MRQIKHIHTKQRQEGSTLIELLIALSIFSIFVVVAIGGFIQSLSNQRLVLKLMSATDNMSLTLEQMMREMRVGYHFFSTGDAVQFERPDQENGITVEKLVTYSWDSDAQNIRRIVSNLDGSNQISEVVTAQDVEVSHFDVVSTRENDPGPYRTTLSLGVSATDKGRTVTNYIQTTVSSRVF